MRKNLLSIGLCAATIGASFLFTTTVDASTTDSAQSNEPKQEVVAPSANPQENKQTEENGQVPEQNRDETDPSSTDKIAEKAKQMTEEQSKHLNDLVAGMSEEDKKNLVDHLYNLDKPDELSDAELKEKGLDRDTYISNGNDATSLPKGTKFKVIGKATIYGQKAVADPTHPNKIRFIEDRDNPLFSVEYTPHHHRDGSIYTIDEVSTISEVNFLNMLNDPRFDTDSNFKDLVDLSSFSEADIFIQPFESGKAIYVDVNHELNNDDVKRGYVDSGAGGASDPVWDRASINQYVDLSKTGRYDGAFGSVQFKNGTGTTFGVPVIVCDPEGKTFHLKVNDAAPELADAVTVDPIKNTDADYADLKLAWENPESVQNDMKAAGTYQENVLVTYPDGSKGKTAIVTIIVAGNSQQEENKDPEPKPDPTPTPDPEPTPDPTPEPAPTPKPEVPAEEEKINDEQNDEKIAPVHAQEVVVPRENKTKTASVKVASVKKMAVKSIKKETAKVANEEHRAELPQTGEKTSFASFIGLAIAAISSLLFADRKRKQN